MMSAPMKQHMKRQQRGQGTVELALGTLVFVTILVFGIHFAEIGYMSLKVTEAAHSAMWDATAYQLHDWPNDDSPASTATTRAAADANARYQDLDGRTSKVGPSLSQVFTRVFGVNVQCSTGGSGGISFNPSPITTLAYSDNDGMRCSARAQVQVMGFPRSFVDGANGFFQVRNYTPPGTFTLCAVGRAQNNICTGNFFSMLDDWGLSGNQSGNNPVIPNVPIFSTNRAHWEMAGSAFLLTGAGMGIAGTDLALSTVTLPPLGFFPGGENAFWLSSIAEPIWVQPLSTEGWSLWPTSPGLVPGGLGGLPYTVSYFQREKCFLGKGC